MSALMAFLFLVFFVRGFAADSGIKRVSNAISLDRVFSK